MLYFALVCSFLMLLAVNLASRRGWWAALAVSGLGILAARYVPDYIDVPPYKAGFYLLPVAILNAVLLVIAVALWRFTGRGWRRMLIYSIVATVVAYGWFLPSSLRREAEIERILARYPFVSMEGRAPLAPENEGSLNFNTKRYADWQSELDRHSGTFTQVDYARGLKLLHERAVSGFVDSWGFGVGRMPPSREWQFDQLQHQDTPEQPLINAADSSPESMSLPRLDLERIHADGAITFVSPYSFGYILDRDHVSGFEAHRLYRMPDGSDSRHKSSEVEVARLELVSLLMHSEPCLYLSNRLPQMDALKSVPTRSLDPFENEGLMALRKGEDIYVRDNRMIGSIRNAQQCFVCHGGVRGQLLGAFSYVLRPTTFHANEGSSNR